MASDEKLNIAPCSVADDGTVSVETSKGYTLLLNPSEFNHKRGINYSSKQAIGQLGSEMKFNGNQPEELSFSFVIDVTGVVGEKSRLEEGLDSHVKKIMAIVYTYDGEDHEPNHVRVLWGSQIFYGRLTSMSVDNKMFKPSGVAVRAKVDLAFKGFMTKEEESLTANRSSPDLSHLIEVKAGDTLPLLCYRIYKDSSYYREVARVNNITNIRSIKPGSKLHFPPLR